MTQPAAFRMKVGPGQADNVRFGILLRRLRDAAKFTRAEACSAVGISNEFLRLIEKGKRTPAAGTARIMLQEYGVPFDVRSTNNKYVIETQGYLVEFTSRIQESRSTSTEELRKVIDISRNERLGRIVRHLITADDDTLDMIYGMLV